MGNCQAAEAEAVVIHHPGGDKVDRIYWSVTANEIMNSNPSHYVAQVVAASTAESGSPVKQLKLLRPDDTLVIGRVYRLICFEDVLKEFAAKRSVKLGKLLKESGAFNMEQKSRIPGSNPDPDPQTGSAMMEVEGGGGSRRARAGGRRHQHQYHLGGQWRPALQSISELET